MFNSIITSLLGNTGAPDPIDHPEIAALSMRELADLPMPRHPAPAGRAPVACRAPGWGNVALARPLRLSTK